MPADVVIDASVMGAAFFTETLTAQAQQLLGQDRRFIAPDLLLVEMASLASKKVRRGDASQQDAARALGQIGLLISEFVPGGGHFERAFELAAQHGMSAYDGLYLAIAEERGAQVVTADQKLVRRAGEAGLAHLFTPL